MITAPTTVRTLLTYAICLPVAIFLGYLLASDNPLNYGTMWGIGMVLFVLVLPLLLRWHHAFLIIAWNFGAVLFFLPGRPELWLAAAWLSLTISTIQYILNRRLKLISVPSLTRPLIFLGAVVLVTMKLSGGFGVAVFGSEFYGGKRYILMISAIAGYFALSAQPIQPRRAVLFVMLFFLGSLTNALGEAAPLMPSSAYFLYLLFPVSGTAYNTLIEGPVHATQMLSRLSGLTPACLGISLAMLARYGIRELFTFRRFARSFLFLTAISVGMLGGFRSTLILLMLTVGSMFWLEGLVRSRMLPVAVLALVVCGTLLVGFSDRLPLSMQRTLSFLPLNIDPLARGNAEASTEWRLQMWKEVLPEVPKHLILGKGLGFSAADQAAAGLEEKSLGGTAGTEVVGDYHSGPLSVIIPFGIFGAVGFLWFLAAALRVLHRNYRYGHPAYKKLNTFLFAYFAAKTFFFFVVFGGFYSELMTFTGLVGLSVSLNAGVARPMLALQPQPRPQPLRFRPPVRKAVPAAS
jgi:hypothetical protein